MYMISYNGSITLTTNSPLQYRFINADREIRHLIRHCVHFHTLHSVHRVECRDQCSDCVGIFNITVEIVDRVYLCAVLDYMDGQSAQKIITLGCRRWGTHSGKVQYTSYYTVNKYNDMQCVNHYILKGLSLSPIACVWRSKYICMYVI